MNNHRVSRRWFTETNVRYFKSGELNNHKQEYGKLKKRIPSQRYISKILITDTEKLYNMQISSQVFFKDFIDRFRISTLKWISLKLFFKNAVDRFQNSYQSKNWIV